MVEILPIKLLTPEDTFIFGSLNVSLGKLHQAGLSVGEGIVVTSPNLRLKVTLEHYNFGTGGTFGIKEVFAESLALVKKEVNSIPVPPVLIRETGRHKQFLLNGEIVKGVKNLWLNLLDLWLDQIKDRLWNNGFFPGITDSLEPQVVIFVKKIQGIGIAFFDPFQDDVEVKVKAGKLHPNDLKRLVETVQAANKKLFIPHEYNWVIDRGVKLVGVRPYTPLIQTYKPGLELCLQTGFENMRQDDKKSRSAVKVFFELSTGFTIEKNIDGVYIASEKIFDLNKPSESFENIVFKLVESASTFPELPILFKLADKSEGMGKVRGVLRLIHQKSLFEPLADALDFARHKKNLTNIHIVVPFVRGVNELLQIKRDLAVKKLQRKNSLELWMEICVPENIINMEEYLVVGIDGVVFNLDELVSYLNGFDAKEGELVFYKNEVDGLIKFLEDGIRLLHKSKTPFIAYGSLALYPKVLEFLVEKGVMGVVVERYEACSAKDLLHQVEKKIILRHAE